MSNMKGELVLEGIKLPVLTDQEITMKVMNILRGRKANSRSLAINMAPALRKVPVDMWDQIPLVAQIRKVTRELALSGRITYILDDEAWGLPDTLKVIGVDLGRRDYGVKAVVCQCGSFLQVTKTGETDHARYVQYTDDKAPITLKCEACGVRVIVLREVLDEDE